MNLTTSAIRYAERPMRSSERTFVETEVSFVDRACTIAHSRGRAIQSRGAMRYSTCQISESRRTVCWARVRSVSSAWSFGCTQSSIGGSGDRFVRSRVCLVQQAVAINSAQQSVSMVQRYDRLDTLHDRLNTLHDRRVRLSDWHVTLHDQTSTRHDHRATLHRDQFMRGDRPHEILVVHCSISPKALRVDGKSEKGGVSRRRQRD